MKTRSEFSPLLLSLQPSARLTATWCAALALIACLGCNRETNRQLFERYNGQFAEKREQFKQIAQLIPPPSSVRPPASTSVSPKPVYNERDNGSNNTEILMFDQLLDPDIGFVPDHKRLDLLL